MSDRSSLVASDGNNKVKVGQGFIENDWLLDFLYKFITKEDACSGVHAGLAVDKIPSQYSKNNLKYLDVLDFLTAVTSWSQRSE
jgi:hypothetical protein